MHDRCLGNAPDTSWLMWNMSLTLSLQRNETWQLLKYESNLRSMVFSSLPLPFFFFFKRTVTPIGSCHLAGVSISGMQCRKLLLFLMTPVAIVVVWVAKKYFIGYVKHGMCLMRSIFCYFHGSMDSTRCCKHSSGRFGPCWLHSDAFILLSTHSTSSQRCSVWLRYEERLSYGRKTEVTVMSGRILQQCVHVKWHHVFI